MRKQLRLVAIAALGALTCSCIHEREFVQYALEPEAISFVLGSTLTRAEKETTPQVNRYSLGTDDHGNLFTLEETVTWMDDIGDSPATRGTPAYSENLQDALGSAFNGRAYNPTSGALVIDDGAFQAMEDGVRWRRAFGFDPWLISNELTFFINMPAEVPGLTNTSFNKANGTFSFDYETPATAEEQQDLLVAKAALDKDSYLSQYQSGGARILLRHALTGIKFAIGNNHTTAESGTQPEGQVETFITKVEFIGLKGKGSAVFNPDERYETTTDVVGTHSSKDSFTWTYDTTAEPMTFSQEFTETDIQDFSLTTSTDPETGETQTEETGTVHAPSSFYEAGNLRNLNTENASYTFWFIPQTMTADVKVRVTFYVWNGTSQGEKHTRELNLGSKILSQTSDLNYEWEAGQIRTFKLSPTAVDVGIEEFAEPDPETPLVISQPDIRNTGSKDAWIRVALVGNWVDSNTGEIVTRYWNSAATTPAWADITPWAESQGTFSPALTTGSGAWRKNGDYWYYNAIVPAGKRPGEAADGTGTYAPLFNTYTKPASPTEGVDLMFDIVVQAIDAAAGNSYSAAWTAVGAYN